MTTETLATSWPDTVETETLPPPFVNLAPFLAGDMKPEKPSVARVLHGGGSLFYAGRLNELHGEPGEGKTNVLIAACNAVLADGGRVLYIDPEDNPQGFVLRARGLGGDVEALAERCHYLHNPTPDEIAAAVTWAGKHNPDLVILDGFAEALAAEGLNEDAAGDVLQFFRERLRPFADTGAAVVVADHVAKSTEGRGRWARGSGAKMGRYDGLVLAVEMGEPYTPTEPGFVKLRIAKDRNGGAGAQRGAVVVEVHFTPARGHTEVSFRTPQATGSFRPTAIMEKIVDHLAAFGEATKRGLCEAIPSKRDTIVLAIQTLIEDGQITCTIAGQKHILKLAEGATVPRSPTVPQPFPENGQGVVSNRSPVSPPIGGTENGNDAGRKITLTRPNRSPHPTGENPAREAETAEWEIVTPDGSTPPQNNRAKRAAVFLDKEDISHAVAAFIVRERRKESF